MTLQTTRQTFSTTTQAGAETLATWLNVLPPAIETLRRMAGTTEDEFLQIGSQLQSFYQRSKDITQMANQLVEIVSGDRLQRLIGRLEQMMADMEAYLSDSRSRSGAGCITLEKVSQLLDELSGPMEGFQKMNKALRMLSISTKIESARLGELGSGFVNLAMDVEKLSHQVNEKSSAILEHRHKMASTIASNLISVRSGEAAQDAEVRGTLASTAANLQKLIAVNDRCTSFGAMVSTISADVSSNISEVVSSQQTHDITRQQVEHVVEALERLIADFSAAGSDNLEDSRRRTLIIEAGDVCELQEAQLRFASSELYSAVCTIVDNLRDVAHKQSTMAHETMSVAGAADSGGSSFVDDLRRGLSSVTSVLAVCARTGNEMGITMRNVAATIQQITGFVGDIEFIGSEIDLIALNSQVKAALTGREGAALGVLAEAIKRLSDEAVRQTASVSATLTDIQTATIHLSDETDTDDSGPDAHIANMGAELDNILKTLGEMNNDLFSLLAALGDRVGSLTQDVEQATVGIDVHERTRAMAADVLATLEQIVAQARLIEPASSEFKQNLLHMEKRYTMESERHIHEALARKRSGQAAIAVQSVAKSGPAADSEFGDNVDLF
ncbi:MAG: hypothetical protein WCP20_12365 [Desulfuromonadales bacterium]